MSDSEADTYSDPLHERPEAMEAVFGLSEIAYPEVLERALAHAMARAEVPAEPRWISMGPRNIGGRIVALAQHPKHASIIYAGSAHGGLWRTIDAGDTWENLGGRDFSVPVSAIAISEHDPNTLYVGTGALKYSYVSGRGLWRVRVAGPRGPATFEQLARAPGRDVAPASVRDGRALRYTRIEIDPDDPNRFWAASQTGLWRGVYDPAAPLGDRVDWELAFPPDAGAPNDAPARQGGPLPVNDKVWPPYATDLAILRDPRDTAQHGGRARYLVIYVGIHATGVFRGRYDRQSNEVTWDRQRLPVPFPAEFSRVLISVCRRRPAHLYTVAANSNDFPTPVYRSSNHGDDWTTGGTIRLSDGANPANGQADYDLVLECNPDNPKIVVCGEVDLSISTDEGDHFIPIIEWRNYNRGDRAQHADQHVAIFDAADRRRIWIGNDGGLCTAPDIRRPPGSLGYWRRRGHGITAPQFQDVATHPVLPQLTGGGLQDNGSWIGFGGKTWYFIDSGDGGGMEWHPTSAQQVTCSTQTRAKVANVDNQANGEVWLTPRVIPDVPAVDQTMFMRIRRYAATGQSPFVGLVAQDPRNPGQIMFGWIAGSAAGAPIAYRAPGPPPASIPIASPAVPGEECSALAFGPPLPATSAQTDGWIGTDAGSLFFSANAPAGAFNNVPTALPQHGGLIRRISDVAVHPRDPRIVAVSSVDTGYSYLVTITTGGARGTADFTWQRRRSATMLAPASAPVLTAANFAIPGAPFTIAFTNLNFTVGDSWLIFSDGEVRADAANAGPGDMTAIQTTLSQVRIRITTLGARGVSQFTWQVGTSLVAAAQATVATFNVPGTHLVIAFSNANFALNDAWTVQPTGQVTPDAGNAGPGTLTAVARDSGRVHITYDRGVTWQDITHRDVVPAVAAAPPALPAHERQHDLDALPPGPVACLKFDASGADYRNLTLYAGTLAGVYRLESLPTPTQLTITGPATVNVGQTVQLTADLTFQGVVGAQNCTTQVDWVSASAVAQFQPTAGHLRGMAVGNAVITATRGALVATHNINVQAGPAGVVPAAPPAAPTPPVTIAWKPFNNRLPLTPVTDIECVAQGRILRAATFGRGIWDCDLDGAPTHRLFIRQLVTEDGRAPRAPVNVRITTAGAVGVAQFTLAIDGVPTALPAQATAASFVIPGAPLTIQFAGADYRVNDSWTIFHTGAVTANPANAGAGVVTATITPRAIPALLANDPRLPPGTVAQDLTHSFDIRVDVAPFQFFDDRIDGVEFDEELGVRTPRRLERCAVYVQVHQAGTDDVTSVQVRLFFSAAGLPAGPIAPGTGIPAALLPTAQFYNATFTPEPVVIRITSAVPLPPGSAEFTWKVGGGAESPAQLTQATVVVPNTMTLHFGPGNYALGDTWTITPDGVVEPATTNTSTGSVSYGPLWRRVGTVPAIQKVTPETPVVVRFDWVPPAGVSGDSVALLALVSGNGDALPVAPPAAHVTIAGLIQQERRAALRIVPIAAAPVAALYIRDGIDDDMRSGNVAFVARSPDIMVPHPDVANPAVDLRDLLDQRPQDHLVGNTPNRIYVRVHNAGPQIIRGHVHLWAVELDDLNTPSFATATWTRLATPDGDAVGPPLAVNVPAHGSALVHMDWTVPASPPGQYKAFGLIALVRSDDGADGLPDVARVTSLATFWQLFGGFFDSDNAALRVLRHRAP